MNTLKAELKYPRTPHVPWSMGMTSDDKMHKDMSFFEGKEVWVSEKMDGENTSMTRDAFYARSLDSKNHPSRNFVKGIWGSLRYNIPEGYRICGENLFAKHSIKYDSLKSYFLVFSVWKYDECISYSETQQFALDMNLHMPKTLYLGKYDQNKIGSLHESMDLQKQEGFVIRATNAFNYADFSYNIAKFVRKNHVATDQHWMNAEIEPNGLAC